MTEQLPRSVRLYAWAIIAMGAVVLGWLTYDLFDTRTLATAASDLSLLVFFFLLMLLACSAPVTLPRGGVMTVGFAVDFAALLVAGPAIAAWAAAFSWVLIVRGRWFYAVSNAAQTALSLAAAGWVYHALGGQFVFDAGRAVVHFQHCVWALLVSGIVYVLANTISVSIFVALAQRRPLFGIWQVNASWLMPQFFALAPFGILMAMVYQVPQLNLPLGREGLGVPIGVALFLLPLLWARHAFQGYTEMRQVHLATVEALSNALEGHDTYTGSHSDEVGRISTVVGRELRFPESRMDALRLAAVMHDIGKCSLDMEPILSKGRDLTEEDWQIIRRHPKVGADIIRQMEISPGVAEIVLHTHERPDGKGYPDGLREGQIDLGASIVAVVDAYHAMTSDRSYRKAMPEAEAIAELKKHAGTQFDQRVVAAVVALWERGELSESPPDSPKEHHEPAA